MNVNLTQSDEIVAQLKRVQLPAFIVGIIGLVVWAASFGTGLTIEQFFQTYLFAFLFWMALPLGSFALLLLQHTINGYWGVAIRRMLESAALTLPVIALMFIPIAAFAMPYLYEWSIPEVVAHDPILQHKVPYLNVPFFIIRAVLYFSFWIGTTFLLVKWSKEQDKTGDPAIRSRFRMLSGPGIVFFVLSMTFAAVDWGMSLEPHWFSAIYGGIFIIGQGLTTFAFMILMLALLSDRKPLSQILVTKQFHDLGNLLFAFTILWTYFSLSQFLIMWSGNLPEETPWYLHRQEPGWQQIAVAIVLFQFVLPFFMLLQRFIKRRIKYLWKVALVVILMRFVELFWFIVPAFADAPWSVHWAMFVSPIAVGGIWIALFIEVLKRRPIVPVKDPLLQELLHHA